MNINIKKFKFEGIDDWNRPVYKQVDSNVRIGSVDILFPNKEIAPNNTVEEIDNYFKNNLDKLSIFGTDFNCEPLGYKLKTNIIKIINNDKSKENNRII